MKTLLKNGFKVRRKLILTGKSHLPDKWAIEKMKYIEYWLVNGDIKKLIQANKDLIIILLPTNFIRKFNTYVQYNNRSSRFDVVQPEMGL